MNTFGYVGGNPLNRIDPTGEAFFLLALPFLGVSKGTVIAVGVAGTVGVVGVSCTQTAGCVDAVADGIDGVLSPSVGLGPWGGSSTRPTTGSAAGEEAAGEIIEEDGACPVEGPCSLTTQQRCKNKCIEKSLKGYGRNDSHDWIQQCTNACTDTLGCSNIGGFN